MRVTFIICSNGLGHFKRCFRLVYDWLLKCPNLRFDIYCERWQLELTREWKISKRLSCVQNVNFHFDKLQGSIKWLPDKSSFSFSQYQAWLDFLRKEEPLLSADLVVSDNLVGVLEIRRDCLLSGSFLWSDLLKQYDHNREIEMIVNFETQILAKIKPVMICVKDLVMPGVMDETNPILMPWFCERRSGISTQSNSKAPRNILVSPGGTSNMVERFKSLVRHLASISKFNVFVSSQLYEQLASIQKKLYLFNFDETSFNLLDLIICRPGVGSLTDGVQFIKPIIAIGEHNNAELVHNARRVEQLGIGRDAITDNNDSILSKIYEMTEPDEVEKFKSRISVLETGGIQQTVDFLQNRLIGE